MVLTVVQVIYVQETRRSSLMNMSYSHEQSLRNMNVTATTTLEPLIKVVSKVIQNVDFVKSDSMETMSCILTVATNMSDVISVIGEIVDDNSNTTKTTMH